MGFHSIPPLNQYSNHSLQILPYVFRVEYLIRQRTKVPKLHQENQPEEEMSDTDSVRSSIVIHPAFSLQKTEECQTTKHLLNVVSYPFIIVIELRKISVIGSSFLTSSHLFLTFSYRFPVIY